jgi:hypothetical protein
VDPSGGERDGGRPGRRAHSYDTPVPRTPQRSTVLINEKFVVVSVHDKTVFEMNRF